MAGTSSGRHPRAPITTKDTRTVRDDKYYVVSSSMQGWRDTMEDARTVVLQLPGDPTTPFFGVYDGHGGSTVSIFVSNRLQKILPSLQAYKEKSYGEAIIEAFLMQDEELKNEAGIDAVSCGSTAIVIIIKEEIIFCGNAGDCRAIASFNQGVIPLSKDHKPDRPKEKTRIEKAGGFVKNSRVNGKLGVSRGFGDFYFKLRDELGPKEQMVTCCPEVNITVFDENLKFIVMACDGIWNSLSNVEVEKFIADRISEGSLPEKIVEDLMDSILSDTGERGKPGCDNMTVILIIFIEHIPQEYRNKLRKELKLKSIEKEDKATQVKSIGSKSPTKGRSPQKSSKSPKTPKFTQSPQIWRYN